MDHMDHMNGHIHMGTGMEDDDEVQDDDIYGDAEEVEEEQDAPQPNV